MEGMAPVAIVDPGATVRSRSVGHHRHASAPRPERPKVVRESDAKDKKPSYTERNPRMPSALRHKRAARVEECCCNAKHYPSAEEDWDDHHGVHFTRLAMKLSGVQKALAFCTSILSEWSG
jgi:hypothetical protein